MTELQSEEERPLDPVQARIVARARWLMLISGLATVLGIAVVIGVVGYRVFRSNGSMRAAEVTALLPKGARIMQTVVTGERIVVIVEVGGTTEIRSFDTRTLQPAGRLTFATEP